MRLLNRVLFFLVLLLAVTVARAELWKNPNWALVGSASGSTGYDSNLTLSNDGLGSGFFAAEPALRLTRHGSSTKLDLRLAANLTHYLEDEGLQTDGAAAIDYAYPTNALPRFVGSANWRRFTGGNASLGRRVTVDVMETRFDGRLYSTGKFVVRSGAAYQRQDYSAENLNTNQRVSLTLGAGFEPDPHKEITLNLLAAAGSSEPRHEQFMSVRNQELGLLLQGRGVLAAKIVGTAYVGAAAVRYRRAFNRSQVLPIAGGEIEWKPTVRSRLLAGLEVGADFSPEGESLTTQRLTVAFEQTIRGPWRWSARAVPAYLTYHREMQMRSDRSLGGGLSLLYDPSEQFDVSLSYDVTDQRSDQVLTTFRRHLAFVNLKYRF